MRCSASRRWGSRTPAGSAKRRPPRGIRHQAAARNTAARPRKHALRTTAISRVASVRPIPATAASTGISNLDHPSPTLRIATFLLPRPTRLRSPSPAPMRDGAIAGSSARASDAARHPLRYPFGFEPERPPIDPHRVIGRPRRVVAALPSRVIVSRSSDPVATVDRFAALRAPIHFRGRRGRNPLLVTHREASRGAGFVPRFLCVLLVCLAHRGSRRTDRARS